MPNQEWRTIKGKRVLIRNAGDTITERALERAMEKAVLPHPISVAIKLANTDWDRAVSLLTDLITDPEKGLKEIQEDENIQLIKSVLNQIQALRKSS